MAEEEEEEEEAEEDGMALRYLAVDAFFTLPNVDETAATHLARD